MLSPNCTAPPSSTTNRAQLQYAVPELHRAALLHHEPGHLPGLGGLDGVVGAQLLDEAHRLPLLDGVAVADARPLPQALAVLVVPAAAHDPDFVARDLDQALLVLVVV